MDTMVKQSNNGKEKTVERQTITISPPNMKYATFSIVGTSPYVQAKFSQKAMNMMMEKHRLGDAAKKGKKRVPRDFAEDCKNATYISTEGWMGIPAPSIRAAMVAACRLVGFKMTHAKLCFDIVPDGFDNSEYKPMIKIEGKPIQYEAPVRNETGVCDIRSRPMWKEWSAKVNIRYDADMFSISDVANLLARAGLQVGIGEGRPNSRECVGLGWGVFKVE